MPAKQLPFSKKDKREVKCFDKVTCAVPQRIQVTSKTRHRAIFDTTENIGGLIGTQGEGGGGGSCAITDKLD